MGSNNSLILTSHAGSRVTGRTLDGRNFDGLLTHFAPEFLVFELSGPLQALRSTEVIPEFHALVDGQEVYSGRATVRGFVDRGINQLCEVALEAAWNSSVFWEPSNDPARLKTECDQFLTRWSDSCHILPEFKLLITDMRLLLQEFHIWLDKLNGGVRSLPAAERGPMERKLIQNLAASFIPSFNHLFEKFEIIAAQIPAGRAASYRAHVKQQLHPLLMCAPFAWRTYTKPLGYAGDYEMVNMILKDGTDGESLFARVLNAWFISQSPAEAHRNRIDVLQRMLEQETMRVGTLGRRLKVLNLGCGPAIEIQRFIAASALAERVDFTLLDFNDETLAYTKQVLGDCARQYRRTVTVNFIKKSVVQLLKGGERTGLAQDYDLVYCAGLYDYLPDRICRQLNSIYHSLLAPGGLLAVTNVDASNPIRQMLDYVLEWHLIYRNAGQFRALAPKEAEADLVRVYADITGVNIFMEVRRS